jgi:hypothetical protein
MKRWLPLVLLLMGMRGTEPPATATFTCAPHDGRAIELRWTAPSRTVIRATVWGPALQQMRLGSGKVKLDQSPSHLGNGSAVVCPLGGTCRTVPGRLEFDVCGTRAGDMLRGRLFYRDGSGPEMVIPFAVQLKMPPGGTLFCG